MSCFSDTSYLTHLLYQELQRGWKESEGWFPPGLSWVTTSRKSLTESDRVKALTTAISTMLQVYSPGFDIWKPFSSICQGEKKNELCWIQTRWHCNAWQQINEAENSLWIICSDMGHKHETRQPSGTRPPWWGTPAQTVASNRKTWQDNECSHSRQAEGEEKTVSRACSQALLPARAVCSFQSPVGLEPLQQCRRDALGAGANCTAHRQTHRTCILSLRARSSLSLKGH